MVLLYQLWVVWKKYENRFTFYDILQHWNVLGWYEWLSVKAKTSPFFIINISTADVLVGQGHDDVIKWKRFPRKWPFVRVIHRWPLNSPHKGQWRGALMFSLICASINGWVNNHEAGDLRRHRTHYDVTVRSHGISTQAIDPISPE